MSDLNAARQRIMKRIHEESQVQDARSMAFSSNKSTGCSIVLQGVGGNVVRHADLARADAVHWEQVYTAVASVCHEFVPQLRILTELHRQQCERRQENMDLRIRVAQVHNPFSLYLDRRRLLAERKLERLHLLRQQLAGTALVDLQIVQGWLSETDASPWGAEELLADVILADLPPAKFLEAFGLPYLNSSNPEGPAGARALWSLAASLWALGAYARAELMSMPPATVCRAPGCNSLRVERVCVLTPARTEGEGKPIVRASSKPKHAPWALDDDPPLTKHLPRVGFMTPASLHEYEWQDE